MAAAMMMVMMTVIIAAMVTVKVTVKVTVMVNACDVLHNVQGTWVWSDGSSYSYNPGWVSNHPTTNTAQVSRILI